MERPTSRIASAIRLALLSAAIALVVAPAASARDAIGFNEDLIPEYPNWVAAQSAAGASSTRLTLSWQRLEQAKDHIDGQLLQQHLNAYYELRRHGIRPLYTLAFAPDWARGTPEAVACGNTNNCTFPPGPEFDDQWAEFVRAMALTFPEADFEIWNEPNGIFWQGGHDPKRYAQLVTIAHQQIKSVSPSSKVVICGCSSPVNDTATDLRFDRFIDLAHYHWPQLANSFDAFSYHVYPQASGGNPRRAAKHYLGPKSYFGQMQKRAQAVLARHGAGSKPILITELGYWTLPYQPFGLTEKQQARAYIQTIRKVRSSKALAGLYFHRGFDQSRVPPTSRQRAIGVLRTDSTAKPAFCRMVILNVSRHRGCKAYRIKLTEVDRRKGKTVVKWRSNGPEARYWCKPPGSHWRPCKPTRTLPPKARSIEVAGQSIHGTVSRPFKLKINKFDKGNRKGNGKGNGKGNRKGKNR